MIKDLSDIKGVGDKTKKGLEKLGIETISDLITYLPRDYDKYDEPISIANMSVGQIVSIEGLVVSRPSFFHTNKMPIVSCIVEDSTGKIRITWFNSAFITHTVFMGKRYVFRGKVYKKGNNLIISQPKVYKLDEYEKMKNKLVPVYHITRDVKNVTLRKTIDNAFVELGRLAKDSDNKKLISDLRIEDLYNDYMPISIIEKRKMYNLGKAYYHIHFPKDHEDLINARNRLVYDEFFLYELGLLSFEKEKKKDGIENLVDANKNDVYKIIENLPYKLTSSQRKVLDEIWHDFDEKKLINRLIQGDVGSGKTIVAFLVMVYVATNGYQAVLMAPTEVLAYQHYEKLSKILKDNNININVVFLSSSVSMKEKKDIKSKIRKGEVNIVIGTHAIISSDVDFDNLSLIVVDEQQRFGVNQRKALEKKGEKVNVIHLSATPIPRTLSMMLFNGLDVSKIEEKPENRIDIKTAIIGIDKREKSYDLMLKEIKKGNRCYVICPMINDEKDEDVSISNYENVNEYAKKISNYVKNKKEIDFEVVIKILHGKMKQKEKDGIMQDFYDGKIDILVSTTVVEVGIDCKDATVIMVENAENFGLATLHQLRGRVGRSDKQSYCIYVDTLQNDTSKERLQVLYDSNDGFYIADQDLKLRGAGDVFGIKQSGEVGFKIGDIYNDKMILKYAMDDANDIIKNKKILEIPEYTQLKCKLDDYLKNGYTI